MIRKVCLILAVVGLSNILCADVQITDVKATPISPWAVIIDYNVNGDLSEYSDDSYVTFSLVASNIVTKQMFMAKKGTVKGDVRLSLGKHRIRWDFPEDEVRVDFGQVCFEVRYEVLFPYLVIDLNEETARSVTYLSEKPLEAWPDEYRLNKIVLRLIPPGSFIMGDEMFEDNPPHLVTLSDFFYIGVFEITQRQYVLVKGKNPSYITSNSYATHAVDCVWWSDIRGDAMIYNWPTEASVDSKSFVGILYEHTGLKFDLPTEAQWEYACRAGSTTRYSYGNSEDNNYMWWKGNAYDCNIYSPEKVGMKLPNDWGLYDMHGNASEWCLDWYGVLSDEDVVNPNGSISNEKKYRVYRGGDVESLSIAGLGHTAGYSCASSHRARMKYGSNVEGLFSSRNHGFRLARTLHKKYTEIFKGCAR